MLRALRENWFQFISTWHMLYDLVNLILTSIMASGVSPLRGYIRDLIFWGLSFINGMFLVSYGLMYDNTIIGSLWFQLSVRTLFIALTISPLVIDAVAPGFEHYVPDSLLLISGGLHSATLATLLSLVLIARLKSDNMLGRWSANVEDLAAGARHFPQRCTWRGTPRDKKSGGTGELRFIRSLFYNAISRGGILYNTVLRRVRPVEKKLYAFCQHVFALTAVALIFTRAITLLTQLANEKLPSRTLVEPCTDWPELKSGLGSSTQDQIVSIVVRYPKERGLHNDMTLSDTNQTYQLFIWAGKQSLDPQFDLCNKEFRKMGPNPTNITDWYWVYSCKNLESWPDAGFQYTLESTGAYNGSKQSEMPDIWLNWGNWTENMNPFTPYIAPPLQPLIGLYTEFQTHPAQRKFVTSSALSDAITGSKPTYKTRNLYLPSLLSSRPLESNITSNSTILASGLIHGPTFHGSSLYAAQSDIEGDTLGPKSLCQVVEEYRVGSRFDILASIGGLLALLQGLHVFLFGRPLFWGLFGKW